MEFSILPQVARNERPSFLDLANGTQDLPALALDPVRRELAADAIASAAKQLDIPGCDCEAVAEKVIIGYSESMELTERDGGYVVTVKTADGPVGLARGLILLAVQDQDIRSAMNFATRADFATNPELGKREPAPRILDLDAEARDRGVFERQQAADAEAKRLLLLKEAAVNAARVKLGQLRAELGGAESTLQFAPGNSLTKADLQDRVARLREQVRQAEAALKATVNAGLNTFDGEAR